MWAILGAGLIIFAGLMAFLAVPKSAVGAKTKDWVGSWKVDVSVILQGATWPGLMTFFNDGNVFADEVPSPLETSGHGSWVSTGANKGVYTFVFFIGDTQPGKWLEGTVSGEIEYDPKADQWNGPFTITLVDQGGEVAFSDTGTMSGTRITAAP